jgi:DNA-binding HxlR family transcriptional regulator
MEPIARKCSGFCSLFLEVLYAKIELEMTEFRYAQFCPIARACELLASRWTLLIVRDLFSRGPLRFSDLRDGLPGISSSVLTERLAHLEGNGIVERRKLAPPAASTVYTLTDTGRALRPALIEFLRWGLRFMANSKPDDHFEPGWLPIGIEAMARREPVPAVRIGLRIRNGDTPIQVTVQGGPHGVQVEPGPGESDAQLDTDGRAAVMLAAGVLSLEQAEAAGLASGHGDRAALERFSELFEMPAPEPILNQDPIFT